MEADNTKEQCEAFPSAVEDWQVFATVGSTNPAHYALSASILYNILEKNSLVMFSMK